MLQNQHNTMHTFFMFARTNLIRASLFLSVLALLLLLSASLPNTVMAANQVTVGSDFLAGKGFLFRTSMEQGGENLLSVTGTNNESVSLTGGHGTAFELGLRLDLRPFERPAFETELTLGLKTSTIEAGFGSAEFSRTSIALSQFYRFKNQLRIGVGIGTILKADLDIDLNGFEETSASLSATPEYQAMLDYEFSRGLSIGARYRATTWTTEDASVDGSSVGVYVGFQTRR